MIEAWRVVLTYTIVFYTYQSTFLSKKLNVEEKLTTRASPSVHHRSIKKVKVVKKYDLLKALLTKFVLIRAVYHRNHYFGLGPIHNLKPKLANTFGRYHN